MADSGELVRKLQFKPGQRVWLIDAPADLAGAIAASEDITVAADGFDAVLAFAAGPADVAKIAGRVLKVLAADGLLWFAYRKGAAAKASGLSRDDGWAALADANWRPVRSISIDDEWTGLRFRPVAAVKSKKPDAWRTRGQG